MNTRLHLFRLVLWLPALLAASPLFGQNEYDALRYASVNLTGTARSMGMGGAMTAVGADFSCTTINPAGLGLYRKSEAQISPAFQLANTRSQYLGDEDRGSRFSLDVPSLGAVFQSNVGNRVKGFKSFTIAIGYNQIENYSRRVNATGINNRNSITNWFAELANGATNLGEAVYSYDPTDYAKMAYDTYYLDNFSQAGDYNVAGVDSFVDHNGKYGYIGAFQYGGVQQNYYRNERGHTNEWDISFGGNWSDRVYFGATVGIRNIRYRMTSDWTEIDVNGVYDRNSRDTMKLHSYNFSETLDASGYGFNLRLGVIAQPLDEVRVGASIQTPTWNRISEKYSSSMQIVSDDNRMVSVAGADNIFDYTVITPFSANIGVAAILNKMLILSGDVEFIDYSSTELRSNASGYRTYFNGVNKNIAQYFRQAVNLRIGGELKLEDFYLRLGFAYYSAIANDKFNTYQNINEAAPQNHIAKTDRMSFSGGLGIRGSIAYCDLAYVQQVSRDVFARYTLVQQPANVSDPNATLSPIMVNRRTFSNVVFTVGIFFGRNAKSSS